MHADAGEAVSKEAPVVRGLFMWSFRSIAGQFDAATDRARRRTASAAISLLPAGALGDRCRSRYDGGKVSRVSKRNRKGPDWMRGLFVRPLVFVGLHDGHHAVRDGLVGRVATATAGESLQATRKIQTT